MKSAIKAVTRQQTNQNLIMLWFHRLKEVQKIKKIYRTVGEWQHCNPIQGQNRARTGFSLCTNSQGKTCFHYREPLFSLQGPCIHYREFPVRISTQGNPCNHYREWVCSALYMAKRDQFYWHQGTMVTSIYWEIFFKKFWPWILPEQLSILLAQLWVVSKSYF